MCVKVEITQPMPDPNTIREGLISFGRQSFQFAAVLCSFAAVPETDTRTLALGFGRV